MGAGRKVFRSEFDSIPCLVLALDGLSCPWRDSNGIQSQSHRLRRGFPLKLPLSFPTGRISMELRLAAILATDVVGYLSVRSGPTIFDDLCILCRFPNSHTRGFLCAVWFAKLKAAYNLQNFDPNKLSHRGD